MTATDVVMPVAAVILAGALLWPRTLKSMLWRATVTPLASIIGSGFLVAGPILATTVGTEAWLAMVALCALAYLFGAAIRRNILTVEPLIEKGPPRAVRIVERGSELALTLAYFISVAYYLNLFSAFGLRGVGVVDPLWSRVTTTVVLALLGGLSFTGGLKAMERLTVGAVGIKLAVIGGVIVGLVLMTVTSGLAGDLEWPVLPNLDETHDLRVLLGLVILVQGFETSRYLGSEYDGPTRVRTMRWAQWLSAAIYVAFIVLATPYFSSDMTEGGGETAIIDMLRPLGLTVAPMLILAALCSQLSAAVADTSGAGGLLSEAFGGRFNVKIGNLVTLAAAVVITWVANIYEIIAWASQAFVAYYGLQSIQAAMSAWRDGKPWLTALYGASAVIAAAVMVFAVPAQA